MKCYECKWLDRSVVLASIPPQYKCTLGFGSHYADHECEYDFMPIIVRCKDCRYCTEYYDRDGYPYWECAEWDGGTDADGFCHYGERKEP